MCYQIIQLRRRAFASKKRPFSHIVASTWVALKIKQNIKNTFEQHKNSIEKRLYHATHAPTFFKWLDPIRVVYLWPGWVTSIIQNRRILFLPNLWSISFGNKRERRGSQNTAQFIITSILRILLRYFRHYSVFLFIHSIHIHWKNLRNVD